MGVENVICPKCGEATFGNVPGGTRLIKLESKRDKYISDESDQSENVCKVCKEIFYTITSRQRR